jgi:hypothetical protein
LAPQFYGWNVQVVETERHVFLGKQIITLLPGVHIKLNVVVHAKSHHFSLLPSRFMLFIRCLLYRTSSYFAMIGETEHTSLIADDVAASCSKAATGLESNTTSAITPPS